MRSVGGPSNRYVYYYTEGSWTSVEGQPIFFFFWVLIHELRRPLTNNGSVPLRRGSKSDLLTHTAVPLPMMDGSDDSEIRKINDGSPPERHPARVILFSLSRKKKEKKLEEKDLNVRPFFLGFKKC